MKLRRLSAGVALALSVGCGGLVAGVPEPDDTADASAPVDAAAPPFDPTDSTDSADAHARIDADVGADADAGDALEAAAPDPCSVPLAPVLAVIADSEVLSFAPAGSASTQIASLSPIAPVSSATFAPGSSLALADLSGPTRILAQRTAISCAPLLFDAVYDVEATYEPAPPASGTSAFAYDSGAFVRWATRVVSYLPGSGVTESGVMDPEQALGPAGDSTAAVVSLGNGGQITLLFDPPIADGDGWDLAVFENAFADTYLELGFVEVSSDGIHFQRFDSAFRAADTACAGCSGTATNIGGLAGKYVVGQGTPFDLSTLRNFPLVRAGTVDLAAIRQVRIVDIVGDLSTLDSFGRPITDPLSSAGSSGFDLDAIGALHR